MILIGGSYWPIKIKASELHFSRSFQGYPTGPYLAHSNTHPKYCIWPYLGAYLSALNMVKWGIPFRSIGPTSQKGGEEGGAVWREGDIFGKNAFFDISFYWPMDQESTLRILNFQKRCLCETPFWSTYFEHIYCIVTLTQILWVRDKTWFHQQKPLNCAYKAVDASWILKAWCVDASGVEWVHVYCFYWKTSQRKKKC